MGNLTASVAEGLVLHHMAGILPDRIREVYGIPEGFHPMTAVALGYEGEPGSLEPEWARKSESEPRTRKPLQELFFHQNWGDPFAAGKEIKRFPLPARLMVLREELAIMTTKSKTHLEEIAIGMSAKDRETMVDSLNGLLADLTVLYIKARNYHWNVEGTHFFSLHAEFEKLYTALSNDIDLVAERARALGGIAAGTMAQYLELATLKEASGSRLPRHGIRAERRCRAHCEQPAPKSGRSRRRS